MDLIENNSENQAHMLDSFKELRDDGPGLAIHHFSNGTNCSATDRNCPFSRKEILHLYGHDLYLAWNKAREIHLEILTLRSG